MDLFLTISVYRAEMTVWERDLSLRKRAANPFALRVLFSRVWFVSFFEIKLCRSERWLKIVQKALELEEKTLIAPGG